MIEGMRPDGEGTLRLIYTCAHCRKPCWLAHVDTEGLQRFLAGEPSFSALPGLTEEQRETLTTGAHPACLALIAEQAAAQAERQAAQ